MTENKSFKINQPRIMTVADNIIINKSRVRLAIFLLYFCMGICFASWASRIPDIKSTLNLGDAKWGTILLMIPVGQVFGLILSGLFIAKVKSRNLFQLALIGYALTLLCIGISLTEYTLIISLLFFGFFGNFCNITINTQAIILEKAYNKPIMASFHGGWSLAGMTGAVIGLLMSWLHIRPIYHFCLIGLIVILTLILNTKYLLPDIKKEKNPDEISSTSKKNKPELFLYLLGLIAFCGMVAEGTMTDWSGIYLIDVVGLTEYLAPIGLVTYMTTMASGRFIVDKITRKWGRQRIIQMGGILITIGFFLIIAFPYFPVSIIAFMIIGFGTAGIVPSIYSTAGQKTRISTGVALTIVSSVSFFGFLAGPPLIGYISAATNLRYAFAIVGLLGIGIVVLASTMKVFKNR